MAVASLEACADDYLTKPFSPAELRARVQSRLPREGLTRGKVAEPQEFQEALGVDVGRVRASPPLTVDLGPIPSKFDCDEPRGSATQGS